jgi:hypothetical protein
MLFNGAKVKNFTLAPWGDQRVFTVYKKIKVMNFHYKKKNYG